MKKTIIILSALVLLSGSIKAQMLTDCDRIRPDTIKNKIICIAYSQFVNSKLEYIKADTIERSREFWYSYRYNKKSKKYYRSIGDMPLRFLTSNGSVDYKNEKFFYKGHEIYPIEIITSPIIK